MSRKISRKEYREKFNRQMNEFNYILQDGEQIVQCKAPYPAYWFVSNKGYLFSAYFEHIRIVKANHRYMGVKNKDGIRTNQDWYYTYKVKEEKYNRHIPMHKLIGEHFLKNEFDSENDEVHHIRKKSLYKPNDGKRCNSADNLQVLPREIHKNLTYYASKTSEQHDKEIGKKLKESGCPTYQCTQEDFQKLIMAALQQCSVTGVQPVAYVTTLDDDVANIQAEAHLLKAKESKSRKKLS